MLTLLLVCSFSPKVQKYLLGFPEYRKSGASTLNDLLQATMLCIRAINRTIVGYVRCARFPQMQALASLFACGQPAGVRLQGNACDSTQNPLCKLKRLTISRVFLVYHKGFEPLAFWSVAKRSIQLS